MPILLIFLPAGTRGIFLKDRSTLLLCSLSRFFLLLWGNSCCLCNAETATLYSDNPIEQGWPKSAHQLLPRAENLGSDKTWKSAHSFTSGMLEMLHVLLFYSCVLCANPHGCTLTVLPAFHTSESMNVYLPGWHSPRAQSKPSLDQWV